jgi:hypothetical protein
MFLYCREQIRIELMIQITGDVLPHVLAFQVHENHLRKNPCRAGACPFR